VSGHRQSDLWGLTGNEWGECTDLLIYDLLKKQDSKDWKEAKIEN